MAKRRSGPSEGTWNFAQVLRDERIEIAKQCEARKCGESQVAADLEFGGWPDKPDQTSKEHVPDMLGLAFSGGGIRSACVGMGVLQRLAQAGILRQVHYISGISGGGYLLGWLTAWIQRSASLGLVEAQLAHNTSSGEPPSVSAPPDFDRFIEPMSIHYLRRYSSYLTPRVGLVSGDTLAMISVYLRNLFLNQLLLGSALVCLTLILQLFSPAILWQRTLSKPSLYLCAILFLAAFAAGVLLAGSALKCIGQDQVPKEKPLYSTISIGCGLLACTLLWVILPTWYADYPSGRTTAAAVVILGLFGFLLSFSHARDTLKNTTSGELKSALHPVTRSGWEVMGSLVAAWVVFGAVCSAIDLGFRHWLLDTALQQVHVSDFYVVFGLPALLLALTLQSYLFIGLLGTAFPDGKREWLARGAGYFLLFAAIISLVMGIALWGPMAMHILFTGFDQASWRKYVTAAVLPGGWLFVVVTGLLGANSSKSSGDEAKPGKLDFIIAIAPPVFIGGLLVLVSWGTHGLVRHTTPFGKATTSYNREYLTWATWRPVPSSPSSIEWDRAYGALTIRTDEESLAPDPAKADPSCPCNGHAGISWPISRKLDYTILFAAFFLVTALLARRLDVNEFSLHLFYRNRLVRAFLGASQPPPDGRRPSPFTGFALRDDIPLDELTMDQSKFQGPYPIWGTTLNLTAGEDLAWQQRKGASFIYSPLYCGWDYVNPNNMPKTEPEKPGFDADLKADQPVEGPAAFGFRATGPKIRLEQATAQEPARTVVESEGYGGPGGKPYLGTAMAASGAAVSPNSGYHTRPGVAALLAIFNLRLGWWTGNPRNRKTWRNYSPSITYLIAELMGYANDTGSYVYLSDGGHFENLGLYELVRRKVRFIICSDADADPNFAFQDLGNAIDKCRRDFGVQIHLRAQRDIAAEGGKGFRSGHYAIGEIVYPGQSARGCLLYIKSSLTNDEPSDVLGMKAQDAAFPHDTTANQFFNESMFESYRALGEHMLDVILTCFKVDNDESDKAATVRKLFHALAKKGEDQKRADALPKPPPVAVAVTGGVSVQVAP